MLSSYTIFYTRYIEFYLESVASAENISLLYHLSGKAKTVRDSESHLYSEVGRPVDLISQRRLTECQNLYALSELAQHIIKDTAKRHSWTLQSFPMKVKLPMGILRPLPNAEAANKVHYCLSPRRLTFNTMFDTDFETSVPPAGGIRLAKQSDKVSKS